MSLKRRTSFLAACGSVLLLGTPVFAQTIADMELFAPPDLGGFGGGPRPNEGLFFSYDFLYWSISHPQVPTLIGSGGHELTDFLNDDFTWGYRVEAGAVRGHDGLFFSLFDMRDQVQVRKAPTTIEVGKDPVTVLASSFQAWNTVDTWGLELDYLRRSHPLHNGGIVEVFAGARYLEFDEKFHVYLRGANAQPLWLTDAENHIVGPQIGLRWFKQWGRFQASAEGRYLAGFNRRSFHQIGRFGFTSFNSTRFEDRFSNVAELRVDLKYQLTKAFFLRVGWTGLWLDGVARASNMVGYDNPFPYISISDKRDAQGVFMNGVNFGFVFNR